MQVKRNQENPIFTLIDVMPWPHEPFASTISVHQQKRDYSTGAVINDVQVWFGQARMRHQDAYEYAQAILRAVDIARRLEQEGAIVLEGEEEAAHAQR